MFIGPYGPLNLAGQATAYAVLVPTEAADRLMTAGLQVSLTTMGVTLFLILAGALIFVTAVTRPVTTLARAATAIGHGDLAQRVQIVGQGEIGVLGRAFNSMAASLQQLLSAERTQHKRDRALLTGRLSAAATDLAAVADRQATSAAQQVVAGQLVTDTLLQSNQELVAITTSAREVAEVARLTLESAGEGTTIGRSVLDAMRRLDERGTTITQELADLSDTLRQVQQVVEVMDEVSDTVHILALNAAIEAAAAGPYGVRFSAVAAAVNELAQRSKAEAATVAQLVETILVAGQHAVASAQAGATEISRTEALVAQAEQVHQQVAARASRDLALVEQIVQAIDHLRVGEETVMQSAPDLQQLAQAGDEAAQEVRAGAGQLETLAGELEHAAQAMIARATTDQTRAGLAQDVRQAAAVNTSVPAPANGPHSGATTKLATAVGSDPLEKADTREALLHN